MHQSWFDISTAGWQRLQAARPLAALLTEAVQNAFDAEVLNLSVEVGPHLIVVEDDGTVGFADPRLIYTVFLSNKRESARLRGRQGRGLKDLIASAEAAVVDTIGVSFRFDERGRTESRNVRRRGTRIVLKRTSSREEIASALTVLRQVIPPGKTRMLVNDRPLSPPPCFTRLARCRLPTPSSRHGDTRLVDKSTEVTLYWPRGPEDAPMLLEMGVPVEPSGMPWHVDVGQRLPALARRDQLKLDFRCRLYAVLLDVLVEQLEQDRLQDTWVLEAVASGQLSERALRAYVRRAFPGRTVMTTDSGADDRARQLGFNVLDGTRLPEAVMRTLAPVIQSSGAYLEQRKRGDEEVRALTPGEERALSLYRHLARRITGKALKVRLFSRPPDREGATENAVYDRKRNEIRINLAGEMDLSAPLSPRSLAILLHELAHVYASKHDQSFIDHLEDVSGRAAALLAAEGGRLADLFGVRGPTVK